MTKMYVLSVNENQDLNKKHEEKLELQTTFIDWTPLTQIFLLIWNVLL